MSDNPWIGRFTTDMRKAMAPDAAEELRDSDPPLNPSKNVPYLTVHGPDLYSAERRQVIHIAFLLRQKLPADLIPTILEYAECWDTIKKVTVYAAGQMLTNIEDRKLLAGFLVPSQVRLGCVRSIRFTVKSSEVAASRGWLGWNGYSNECPCAWLEVGIVAAKDLAKSIYVAPYDPVPVLLRNMGEQPMTLKNGRVKIWDDRYADASIAERTVERPNADESTTITEHVTNTRRLIKELRGGDGIEVTGFSDYTMCRRDIMSITIEIVYLSITRM